MRSLVRAVAESITAQAPVPHVARSRGSFFDRLIPAGNPADYMAAYGSVGTLHAIVSRLAESTSSATWRLYRTAKNGERTEVIDHLALRVWNKPNPFTTRQELVEAGQQHYELTGETWYVVGRDARSSIPLELWNVRPDRMRPVPSRDDFIAGYVYTSPDGEEVPLALGDVIMIRHPNPLDPYRGMGPVQTVMNHLDGERYSAEWNRNFFLNGAEPGGVIEVEERLSDSEFDEMTARWKEQHQGVANAHRVAVLERAKYNSTKFSQKDMQFTELSVLSGEKIREAFGFPKPLLGAVDDVNRANAEAAEVVFSRWLVVPRLERVKQALNNDFLPLFGTAAAGLEFDYDSPVPEDGEAVNAARASVVDAATKMISAGFAAPDVLEWLELPELGSTVVSSGKSRDIVEAVQKIYLGVGTVITSDEARTILNDYGADLPVPGPSFSAPSPPALHGQGGDGAVPPEDIMRAIVRLAARESRDGHGGQRRSRTDPDDGEPWRARAIAEPPPPPAGIRTTLPDGAGPDLSKVQADWERELADLLEAWTPLNADQITSVLDQVESVVQAGDIIGLASLSVATQPVAEIVQAAMQRASERAAAQVVTEAADQDVTVHARTPELHRTAATAQVTASLLGGILTSSAAREALRVWAPGMLPGQVRSAVSVHLDSLTDATPRAAFGSVLTQAQRDGRIGTMVAGPSAALYADEVLDGNTCGPCSAVNRKWLGNSDDPLRPWELTYPTGGYVDCKGRSRCRGQVVSVWREGSNWREWVELPAQRT